MLMGRRGINDERGAVAVLAAITALVLVGMSALAVDLGNAFARKRDVQAQADFAALAGANGLGIGNTKSASDPAVVAVSDYLTRNLPENDAPSAPTTVTADQLVDGNDTNGEVYFTGDRMRVVTPVANVQYGLAGVLGFASKDVQADASVKILSGGGVMPFFAVDGCDWGPQTISTPPPGPAPSLDLAPVTETPTITLDPFTSSTPDQIPADPTPSPALSITGSGFSGVTRIGFFRNDGSHAYYTVAVTPIDGSHIVVPAGAIPTSVTSVEEVWYVRAFNGTKWSKADNARPLRVGSAVMECVGAMSSGNFGSLLLPRKPPTNNASSGGWLPMNIAEGLDDPLTLAVHDAASAGANWNCTDGLAGAVVSSSGSDLEPGTNCLDTDTGLPDNSATAGFVSGGVNGGISYEGRLNAETTSGCGAQTSDRDAEWTTPGIRDMSLPGHPEFKINDDLLTCFLDTSVTINTISQETYAGPPVLSEDIYRSPRFFLQPVLGRKPFPGGSEMYSIVGFRPAFLTDQPTTAAGGSMTMGTSTDHNGLSVSGGKISKVKVVFFNINALPPPPDDVPMSDYIGAGPKLIRLID